MNGIEIEVPSDQMLIEGSKLADRSRDSVCFLAVFRNPQITTDKLVVNEWVLGTLVM